MHSKKKRKSRARRVLESFLELLYKSGFFVVSRIKIYLGGYPSSSFVISVGNLTVGGTGKSLVTAFLIRRIDWYAGAVLLRGYRRKGRGNELVDLSCPDRGSRFGDEPVMLARKLSVPVVVGADRAASERLLRVTHSVDYIVLDDAYQNHQLAKDFEILLLDARSPFDNGRCLPAGRLREKDFSRADVIILTHADEVKREALDAIKALLSNKISLQNVFLGRHAVVGVRHMRDGSIAPPGAGKYIAAAGIGSFSGFCNSLRVAGVDVGGYVEYRDHHRYTKKDVEHLLVQMREHACVGTVTTEKDWQKIEALVGSEKKYFFVLEIAFEFLSQGEEASFFGLLDRRFQEMA